MNSFLNSLLLFLCLLKGGETCQGGAAYVVSFDAGSDTFHDDLKNLAIDENQGNIFANTRKPAIVKLN